MGVEKEFWNSVYDIRHAYKLEEKVKEINLKERYMCELIDVVLPSVCRPELMTPSDWFDLVNATPEQRTKAFLLACLEE